MRGLFIKFKNIYCHLALLSLHHRYTKWDFGYVFFLLLFSGLKIGEDNSKNNFLLSQSKHMFWVLKRTMSGSFEHPISGSFEHPISGSFEHPKYMFRLLYTIQR